MAKTRKIKIQGKVKWVRHKVPNKYGNWSHEMYPNPEGLELIRELQGQGLKNKLSKDEDGWHCAFSRPTQKTIKGKVQGFAPPIIVQADGVTPLRDDVLVGNGSDATTLLDVYEHRVPGTESKSVAARWEAMKIDHLIPFIPERDFVETEKKQIQGLDTAPAQTTSPIGWN